MKMSIEEIQNRYYSANRRRGQISDLTEKEDFVKKLREEVDELDAESTFNKTAQELADVALVCFAMAAHFGIDLMMRMEAKMLYNEKRPD